MKRREAFVIAAALFAAGLSPLAAQEPVQAADTTVQGYAPAAPAPAPAPAAAVSATAGMTVAEALGFIDVLPARSPERIQSELDAAKAASLEADARIGETGSQRSQTKAMIEAKKQEISSVNARIKLADREKQEADKAALEAEKKVVERQKQFLERREALHGSEIDQAKASKKLADARQKSLALELELASRRGGQAGAATDPAATLRQDAVIRELERKTLEAQRDEAEAAKDVASRDQDIAKRRLELYQAQSVAAGRGR